MSLSLTANLLTALLCVAVLVQSLRMMRGLKRMERHGLGKNVAALDRATIAAQALLGDLKTSLATDARRLAEQTAAAKELHDELAMLVAMADARASRLAERQKEAPLHTTSPGHGLPEASPATRPDVLHRWKRAAQAQRLAHSGKGLMQ